MKPLITGVILFLLWMIFSTWYYTAHIFPVGDLAIDTLINQAAPDSLELPSEGPAVQKIPDNITLYFDFDKTKILNTGDLHEYVPAGKAYLAANPDACLLLTGHTCDIGSSGYNMDLGKRRATSVKNAFLNNGLTTECIQLMSKGETEPAASNTNEENRKLNRRVTVQINQ